MNRFETYQPINFEILEYVQNPEAFAKILAAQDALFEQKQKEKESMLSAGDKLAQSLKYAPTDSDRAIYEQTISDYRAAQDEVENAYRTKGVSAGEAALRKYKKTLSDDFTNGRASKLLSGAAQWEDTKKRVTEMYKDNPRAANYYLYGEGKNEWIKPYEESKERNIGQPYLLKSMKDEDITKSIVATLKEIKPNVETLLDFFDPNTPESIKNGLRTANDPYHYMMNTITRKYVDEDKLINGVLGNISPDVLEHMELEGRIRGMKGQGELKNLLKTYAIDKEGNIAELNTPEELKAAKANPDLKLTTTFNRNHLYGNQFNALMRPFDVTEMTDKYDMIDNGLKHQEQLRMEQLRLQQKAQQDAIKNGLDARRVAAMEEKNRLKASENAVPSFSVPGDAMLQAPNYSRVNEKGEPVVDNQSVEEFKRKASKRLPEIEKAMKTATPEMYKQLAAEKESLNEDLADIEHLKENFKANAKEFNYVPNQKAEEELKKSGYYDTINVSVGKNVKQVKVKDIVESPYGYVIDGNELYKWTRPGAGAVLVGLVSDKQAKTLESAKQAAKNNEANTKNEKKAWNDFLGKQSFGTKGVASTNVMDSKEKNKQFNTTINPFASGAAGRYKVYNNGKMTTLDEMSADIAHEAGKTDWVYQGVEKGDSKIPATVQFYKKGHTEGYAASTKLTFIFTDKQGKTQKVTRNVTIPSHNEDGSRNFMSNDLDARLGDSDTQAEIAMQQAAKQPKIVFSEDGDKVYSALENGQLKFFIEQNKVRKEIPQTDAQEMAKKYFDIKKRRQVK